MKKDNLGDRMKKYEKCSQFNLMDKIPVVIRLDGAHFHTFTKGLNTPFDIEFQDVMRKTMKDLVDNIQNCILGYTQSDEITLVLLDTKTLETQSWFNNNLQKIVSISASLATMFFNKHINELTEERFSNKKFIGYFDSRAFNIPLEDLPNVLIWRSQDAYRNAVSMFALSRFSHKELQYKSTKDKIEMLGEDYVESQFNCLPYEMYYLKNEYGQFRYSSKKRNYEDLYQYFSDCLKEPLQNQNNLQGHSQDLTMNGYFSKID